MSNDRLGQVEYTNRSYDELRQALIARNVRAATINAASVVGHIDTQSGLLPRDEIDRRAQAAKETLPLRRWSH